MSNVFITKIIGNGTYAIPTNDAQLAAATAGFDALLSGVAGLAYDRVLAWVEDQEGPDGAEGVRTLNCLIEKFTYLTKECPSEAEIDTLGLAMEAALEADASITSIDQQQFHLFQAGAYFLWNRDAAGGFLYPNVTTDDVVVGGHVAPTGKWFADGDLVLNGNTMSGTEVLRVSGSVLIDTNGQLSIADSATIPPINITERAAEPTSPAVGDIYLDDGTNGGGDSPVFRRLVSTGPDVWENIGSTPSFPGIEQIIFVDKGTTTGLEDGTVQNPYHSVGDALTAAASLTPTSSNKILILVYPGVYTESGLSTQDYVYIRGVDRDTCILQNSSTIIDIDSAETTIVGMHFDMTGTNPVITLSSSMASACEINDCIVEVSSGSSSGAISVSNDAKVSFFNCNLVNSSNSSDILITDSSSGNEVSLDEINSEGYVEIDGGVFIAYDSHFTGQLQFDGTSDIKIDDCLIENPNDAHSVIINTTNTLFISSATIKSRGESGGTDYYAIYATAQPATCFMCGIKLLYTNSQPDYLMFSIFSTFEFFGKENGFQRGMNGNCRNSCISTREVSPIAGSEYNFISDAVAALEDGNKLLLTPDTHDITDSINITNDNIVIDGLGAVIRAQSATWVGGVTNNDAVINLGTTDGASPVFNCEINHVQLLVGPNIHGIQVNGGADNKIHAVHVESTSLKSSLRVGILFTDGSASQGERFVVRDSLIDSTSDANAWVDGIHMDGNNTLSTYGYGNGIIDSFIQDNVVKFSTQTCFVFVDCEDSAIISNRADNVCYDAGAIGLAMIGCSECSVSENSVRNNNNAGSAAALWFSDCLGCVVIANSINGDGTVFPAGVELLSGSDNNIVKDNVFIDCTNGIEIASGCDENIINPNQYISGITTRIVDGDTSNRYVGTMRQAAGNPNGVVSGDFGDTYLNTNTNARFICISYPVGTTWRTI